MAGIFFEFNYITKEMFLSLEDECQEIGRLLSFMIDNPKKFS
jgi:hypothetical protein